MPEFGTIKLYVSFESSVGKMLLNKSGERWRLQKNVLTFGLKKTKK